MPSALDPRPSSLARALLPLCALAAAAALAPACGSDDDDASARPGTSGTSGASGSGGSAGAPAAGSAGAASKGPVTEGCPPESELTYENVGAPFLLSWCNGCHSASLPEGSRQSAPVGIDFDTIDKVRAQSARIAARATGAAASMPPVGGAPEAERQRFAEWLACGAPSAGQFKGLPQDVPAGASGSGGAGGAPPAACASLGQALPPAALPRCKAETKGCLEACAGQPDKDACERVCFSAEPAPAPGDPGVTCENCLLLQSIAYAETSGCGPLASEGFCCIIAQCPTFDQACIAEKCAVETESMFYCIAYVTPEAFSSNPLRDACFAAR
jgi:hypothetical protein